jgi:repressor LexA
MVYAFTHSLFRANVQTDVMKTLTSKQKKVFEYIRTYLEEKGVSPTIGEIAEHMCVSSLRTVTQYLESLERKKLIKRIAHASRGIRILTATVRSETVTLPVLSAAGCDNMEVFAQQSFDEFITIDSDFLGSSDPQNVFAFRAVGESMRDAGIATGDLVLAEKTTDVKSKDNVVAIVDGMALIKRINFSPNAVILAPMSPDPQYRPIIMKKDFQVFGRVIEVIKNSFDSEELVYESL